MITTPLTIVSKPVYEEGSGLASARDSRNTSRAWLKSKVESEQNFSTSRTLAKIQRDLTQVKHRVLSAPQLASETIMPFAFYNNPPDGPGIGIIDGGVNYGYEDLTLDGGTLAAGETPTKIRVAIYSDPDGIVTGAYFTHIGRYTTPPTFPNFPQGGSGSGLSIILTDSNDSGKIFSMRDGLIGLRPRFGELPRDDSSFAPMDAGTHYGGVCGNYKQLLLVSCDGQTALSQPYNNDVDSAFSTGNVASIVLDVDDAPVVVSGYDPATQNWVYYSRAMVNKKWNGTEDYVASFWLEIVDTPEHFYVNLMGKAVVNSNYFETMTYDGGVIPDVRGYIQNIIPVAICTNGATGPSDTFVDQFLLGNQIGLFDAYFNKGMTGDETSGGGLAIGCGMNYRGDWDEDSLDGQTFYPGDMVTQGGDTVKLDPSGTVDLRRQYVCKAYVVAKAADGTDPAGDFGSYYTKHWIKISSL